jgi:uncharacterized protein YoxC
MSLTDVLLAVIALCAIVTAISLIRSTGRIAGSAAQLERSIEMLSPRIDRALQESTELITEARAVIARLEEVARDTSEVSYETKQLAVPMIRDLGVLREGTRQLAGLVRGVQAGVSSLRRR